VTTHLGIDIGGTKVAFIDDHGTRSAFTWPEHSDVAHDLELLRAHAAPFGATARGVGVAFPGALDADGRVVVWPSRASWTGAGFLGPLREIFPHAHVRVGDDGDLAALAEADHAGRGDLLYVGVGTGVGGGLVIAGRSCPELGRGSCELGHVVIDRAGARCVCGRRGCLQAEASGPAILGRAAGARGSAVSFADLVTGVRDGSGWALDAIEHACDALATAVITVTELVRPDVVVVGGGFADGVPGFVDVLAARTAALARPGVPVPSVRPAVHGGDSSLHGALLAARGRFG
jgi:kanosamine 6-kinase